MGAVLQDVRFSFRMLAKNPGLAAIAILTLGAGIGATTAVFSVVDGVLLRPIPYEDPHRAVWIYRTCRSLGIHQKGTSIAAYWDWKDRNQVFDDIALLKDYGANIMNDAGAERVEAAAVTEQFFPVLGVEPLLGMVPASDGAPPDPYSAVISYGLWNRCYGGRPDVVGQDVILNGTSHTVIGVMPPGFTLPRKTDVWTPLAVERARDMRTANEYHAIARLSPGVTLEQAQANMRAVSRAIARDYPEVSGWSTDLITLQEEAVGSMRKPLLVLLAAVGLVLLIACANVANLLLARSSARGREVAIRATLGAGRWRLIRQFLCESLLLSLLGGSLGVILAYWGTDFLLAISPGNLPRLDDVRIDGRVLGFTLLLLPCVTMMFGLIPALRASSVTLSETLKEGGQAALRRDRGRIRAAFVVSEIALSLMLLVGASLLIRSLRELQSVDPGIEVERILTMRVALSPVNYPEDHHVRAFFQALTDHVQSVPGVSSAGFTSALPMVENTSNMGIEIGANPLVPNSGISDVAEFQWGSGNYHTVVGQRLEKGRLFDEGDYVESPNVAIINKAMARKFWGDENPVGRRFRYYGGTYSARIVGVVSDVKRFGLNEAAPAECYLPAFGSARYPTVALVVRSGANPSMITEAVRTEIHALDRTAAVYRVQTMRTIVSESMARASFTTLLLSLFAGMAALLAGVGVYGVIAHHVGQRTHEIGLRIAIGAASRQILLLVLRQASALILIGVILGLAGAWALSRIMESLLFGVGARDPLTFACVPLLLIGAALLACYLPARRATKVDPMVALRCE
jgi:putative ABC transport system permease protein